jgi:hypothetical protein
MQTMQVRNDLILDPARILKSRDKDGLRLLGLSRIPRCAGCARFKALEAAYEAGSPIVGRVPPVPGDCDYQICAPILERMTHRR